MNAVIAIAPRFFSTLCAILLPPHVCAPDEAQFAAAHRALVAEVGQLAQETRAETGQAAFSPQVLAALEKVPRHRFVPPAQQRYAYDNRPLPIGYGQTISQPFVVAYMTDLLQLGRNDKVLEIGTGSGYQAAILGELVQEVYSIEIVEPLAARATEALRMNGYSNVQVRAGDGYYGWPEHAPFDAIIVTAAASHVPPPLVQQLKRGGRMAIPLGSGFLPQHVVLVEKDMQGRVRTHELLPVQFVPLTGGH
ncbi:MAG: protein-L-isoaspartate(D-aspartate) O-methyltransferase [Nitrosomonadales bacterium]|nr:MAG: protein-L-isoaspartate(D-aspartate) O-methyltransferase [Nitrosomonadales bacterium]